MQLLLDDKIVNKRILDQQLIDKKIEKAKSVRDIKALLIKIIVVLLVLYGLHFFIFQLVRHTGLSMSPAINDGDLLFVYKLDRNFKEGDIVSVNHEGRQLILRIVATGGQTVNITDDGNMYVDEHNEAQKVFYDTKPVRNSGINYPYKVEEGKVFLCGDYRIDSYDSRIFGAVSLNEIEGKVITTLKVRNI